jgi:hypothetical protein
MANNFLCGWYCSAAPQFQNARGIRLQVFGSVELLRAPESIS